MKRIVKFAVFPMALVAALAAATPSSAQGWGFYVSGPRASFGASSFGYGGYGGYGYGAPGYASYRGHVGYNYRPSFHCTPQVYVSPRYCAPVYDYHCAPPVHHHHHHGSHRW